jgi:hypothetical protein
MYLAAVCHDRYHSAGLRKLQLHWARFSSPAAAALAETTQLTELRLYNCSVPDPQLVLTALQQMPQLQVLELSDLAWPHPTGVTSLLEGLSSVTSLRELTLQQRRLPEAAPAEHLARLTQLTALRLAKCRPVDESWLGTLADQLQLQQTADSSVWHSRSEARNFQETGVLEPCPAFHDKYPQQVALIRKYFVGLLYRDLEGHLTHEEGRLFDVFYARSSTSQ